MNEFVVYNRTLGSLKNADTPVNRLPTEILVRIFSCATALRPRSGRFPYLPQITFSAVCKHWRQIIISNPLLWNFIASHNHLSMVEIALQRSQSIPLEAYIGWCGPDFVDLVQPHVSSIKYLTCDLARAVEPPRQPHPLVVVSPILEWLELRRCYIAEGGRMLSVSETPLSKTAVRISLPKSLRSLSLFFTPLTDHFIHLGTLTNISLQGIVASFETFLLLLKNNVRLEDVSATDVLLEGADRSGETISLPNLRKFSYSGDTIHPFLHRLSAPQRARFRLRFTNTLQRSANILHDVLPKTLASLGMLSIDFVSLKMDHPSSTISICDSIGGGISIGWLDERPSKEAVNWDLLDLRTVREVSISVPPTVRPYPAYPHDINTLLGRTTSLDTLSLSNQGGIYRSLVLSMITPGSTKGLWPSLNKIRVASPVQGFPLRELVNLVKARKEAEGVTGIRQVDVLILRGGSARLRELERLASVDVKIVDSWVVPDEWERGY